MHRRTLPRWLIPLFFGLVLVLGLATVPQYGRPWDERLETDILRMNLWEYVRAGGSGRKRLCILAGAGQRHHVGAAAHQRKHRAGSRRGGVLSAGGRSDGREPDRAQPDDSMARLVLGLIHAGCAGAVRLLPGAGAVPGYQSGGGLLSAVKPPLFCGGALQQQGYRADGPDPLRPLDGPSADEASGRPARAAVCVGGSLLC